MLQRMSVDGDHSDGSGPLMVLLVKVFVELGMVEQPENKDCSDGKQDHTLWGGCL